MSTPTTPPLAPGPEVGADVAPAGRSWAHRFDDRLRQAVLVGWVVVVLCAVVLGERQTSWHYLERAVSSGAVETVHVSPEAGPGSQGRIRVAVRWHDGLLARRTEVSQERGQGASTTSYGEGTGESGRLRGAPSAHLAGRQPGLRVERESEYPGSGGEGLGWTVPTGVAMGSLVLLLLTFLLLVSGAPPWRANRWAWFWGMVVAGPVGGAAFLVLSGPTPGVPAPRHPGRRVTGGRGLALAIAIAMLLALALSAGQAWWLWLQRVA